MYLFYSIGRKKKVFLVLTWRTFYVNRSGPHFVVFAIYYEYLFNMLAKCLRRKKNSNQQQH